MLDTIEANWIVFAVALAAALLVAWWLFGRASSTPARRDYQPDVLDEGVAPAQRNQALIDAAPAAQIVPPPIVPAPIVPPAHGAAMGGIAEAVAIGAQDVVEEAAVAKAEAQPDPEPAAPVAAPAPARSKAKAAPKPKASKPAAAPKPKAEPQAKAEPAAQPAPAPAPPPPPPVEIATDDLARIKGLGPKLQALLPTLGITTFAQIASLSEADLAELDGKLGAFAGRPARDGWVEQAGYLSAGDVAGFEARFGKV